MKPALLFLFIATCTAAEAPAGRVPVLLELFTSEGCSSCPPADSLLRKLDNAQPIPGAELVVLSEHVDYWNQLGWRQYAQSLGGEVYTPELVVDGAKGFVGSDEGDTRSAVREALHAPKAPIRISVANGKISLHSDAAVEGTLYLALAHDAMQSQVTRGENSGRALAHVAVVYSLEKIGKLDKKTPGFDREVAFSPKVGETTRIVAFVEQHEVGRVVALGSARL
jgi:hypothetical protein